MVAPGEGSASRGPCGPEPGQGGGQPNGGKGRGGVSVILPLSSSLSTLRCTVCVCFRSCVKTILFLVCVCVCLGVCVSGCDFYRPSCLFVRPVIALGRWEGDSVKHPSPSPRDPTQHLLHRRYQLARYWTRWSMIPDTSLTDWSHK